MLQTLTRTARSSAARAARLPADVSTARRAEAHRRSLAALAAPEATLLAELGAEGCTTSSLELLDLGSTGPMLANASQLLQAMTEIIPVERGTDRPLTPPQIFTVTDLPAFADFGSEPRLLALAEHYIGLPVTFQGAHLRRDFANDEPVTTELWHKDLEDRRMMKVVVYLADVELATGPFEFARKSAVSAAAALRIHWGTARNQSMGINDAQMADIVPRSGWSQCTGPAGSVVIFDPVAVFHHGRPRTEDRAALFCTYTSASPLRPELCRQYRDDTFPHPAPPGA